MHFAHSFTMMRTSSAATGATAMGDLCKGEGARVRSRRGRPTHRRTALMAAVVSSFPLLMLAVFPTQVGGYPSDLPCDGGSGQSANGMPTYGTEFRAMEMVFEQFNNTQSEAPAVAVVMADDGSTATITASQDGTSSYQALMVASGTLSGSGSRGACSRVWQSTSSTAVFTWTRDAATGADLDWVLLRSAGPGSSGQVWFPALPPTIAPQVATTTTSPSQAAATFATSSPVTAIAATTTSNTATTTPGTPRICSYAIALGEDLGLSVQVDVVASSANEVTLQVAVARHQSWLAFAFSTSGLMTHPKPSRALILHAGDPGDTGDVAVHAFLMQNQFPTGLVRLNDTAAAEQGIEVLGWQADLNWGGDGDGGGGGGGGGGTAFNVTLHRTQALDDESYVVVATGEAGDYDLKYHGTTSGSVTLTGAGAGTCDDDDVSWLEPSTECGALADDDALCSVRDGAQVCFDCGVCSFDDDTGDIDFDAYGLSLPQSRLASRNYRLSWCVSQEPHAL